MSFLSDFIKGFSRTHNKLVAPGGTLIIDDAILHSNLEANSFIAQTATVISTCNGVNGNNEPINFVTDYNWVTIAAGVPIIAPDNCKINSITLTSGSIALYS